MSKFFLLFYVLLYFPLKKRVCFTLIIIRKNKVKNSFKDYDRASLVAQWLRVCLLMQGTRVRALLWEDPTCRGVAGPVSHNY